MEERVGDYVVLGELGRGASGVVFRARGPAGEEVALKLLLAGISPRDPSYQRFRREQRLLAELEHPHIVSLKGVGEHEGVPYLVMEFVRGETLAARLAHGPLPVSEAMRIGRALALGLDHVHQRGIVHRDVKPANVLLSGERVLLGDFGIARRSDGTLITASRDVLGSPGFLPPEQARPDGQELGPAADVYSLGATLFAALTGRPPTAARGHARAILAACRELPPPPSTLRPGLDPRLDQVVLRCLAKEPSERYGSAALLAQDLEILHTITPPEAASSDERWGPYEVLGHVARGGMGVVLRARGPAGREVALKVLETRGQATRTQRERFLREARALARVNHPAVVRIHHVGEQGGVPYMALDLVPGESLAQALKHGPLPELRAASVVAGVARAVAAAHSAGICHRDLKPSNVLLRDDGTPVLVDFGIARDEQASLALSRTGQLLGTPGFMAPEQLSGSDTGEAVDVYGLGGLLYAALTGQPPIHGDSLVELMVRTVQSAPTPPSEVRGQALDPALQRLCLACLEKNPDKRPPTAAEVAESLEALVTGEEEAPRRLWPLAVAALLAALAVGASWGLRRPPTAPSSPSVAEVTTSLTPEPKPDPEALDLLARAAAAEDDQDLARRLLSRAATRGSAEALLRLGRSWSARDPRDLTQARTYLQRASQRGLPEASLALAHELLHGLPRDPQRALQLCERAADLGSAEGALQLGLLQRDGLRHGLPSSPKAALKSFRRAAQGGSAEGAYHLARALRIGDGSWVDAPGAERWLKAAARGEYLPAMLELGLAHPTTPWLQRAADAGSAEAALALGDEESARRLGSVKALLAWARDLRDAGDLVRARASAARAEALATESQRPKAEALRLELAQIPWPGTPTEREAAVAEAAQLTRTRVYVKARPAWERAARLGSVRAMYALGSAYTGGYGVAQDPERARAWYRAAASNGDTSSMLRLGAKARLSAPLVQQRESIAWLRRAVKLGDTRAAAPLGLCLSEGVGCEVDLAEAWSTLEIGMKAGISGASHALAQLILEGRSESRDVSQAVRLLSTAAEAGQVASMMLLARIYREGRALPADLDTAARWLHMAEGRIDDKKISARDRARMRDMIAREAKRLAHARDR